MPPKGTKRSFNPQGTGYDYRGARAAGLKPNREGKWGSRNPKTGLLFKGRRHKTWHETEKSERELGYTIVRKGRRYYSVKK